jgi:tripartite-type tricarboxylate transporter receptor subunit TctC
MFDSLVTGLPHVKDGKLRALAVTSEKRSTLAPDLPTVADVLPGFESVTWFGLYGPKAMPQDVVQKLNAALNAALSDNDVKERFGRLGAEPTATAPAAFAALAQNERAKWKRIIEQRKITVE